VNLRKDHYHDSHIQPSEAEVRRSTTSTAGPPVYSLVALLRKNQGRHPSYIFSNPIQPSRMNTNSLVVAWRRGASFPNPPATEAMD